MRRAAAKTAAAAHGAASGSTRPSSAVAAAAAAAVTTELAAAAGEQFARMTAAELGNRRLLCLAMLAWISDEISRIEARLPASDRTARPAASGPLPTISMQPPPASSDSPSLPAHPASDSLPASPVLPQIAA